MKQVTVYHKETGHIRSHVTVSDDKDLASNIPPDHAHVDGHHDPLTNRIDVVTGKLIPHVTTPVVPAAQVEMQNARVRAALGAAAIEHLIALALGKPGAREKLEAIDLELDKFRGELHNGTTDTGG
jgi:hypothetical protein